MSRRWALAGAVAIAVLVADQASKSIVESNLLVGEPGASIGPLSFTHAQNDGVAFGLAAGGGALLIALTVVALGVLGWWFSRHQEVRGAWVATGLICGGAIGNMADRIANGVVTDFIDVGPWPPFNVADIAITTGVVLLVLLIVGEPEPESA